MITIENSFLFYYDLIEHFPVIFFFEVFRAEKRKIIKRYYNQYHVEKIFLKVTLKKSKTKKQSSKDLGDAPRDVYSFVSKLQLYYHCSGTTPQGRHRCKRKPAVRVRTGNRRRPVLCLQVCQPGQDTRRGPAARGRGGRERGYAGGSVACLIERRAQQGPAKDTKEEGGAHKIIFKPFSHRPRPGVREIPPAGTQNFRPGGGGGRPPAGGHGPGSGPEADGP